MRRIAVMAVAIAMIASLAVGGAVAQDTINDGDEGDYSSADSPSDWEDDGSTTIADFNASPDTYSLVQFSTPDSNTTNNLELEVAHDGTTHYSVDSDADAYTELATGEGSGTDETVHEFNVSHDVLETVPGQIESNTTIDVTISETYEDADGNESTATNEFEVDLEFATDHSVMYIDDSAITDGDYGIEQTDDEGTEIPVVNMTLPLTGEQATSLETTRDVANDTTIDVYVENATAADHFTGPFDDIDAETWQPTMLATMGDSGVHAYADALPDDLDTGTPGLSYDTSSDKFVIEPGDDQIDDGEMDLSINSDPGIYEVFSTYGFDALTTTLGSWSPLFLGGFSLAGGLVVSRRRPGA